MKTNTTAKQTSPSDDVTETFSPAGAGLKSNQPSPMAASASPVSAEQALMVGLQSRRFVVVWPDRTWPLRSTTRLCKPPGNLQPGEDVYYRGRVEQVRSVCRY
ncbi:MAG: hypothetical protein AAFV88_02645 [Planctomycetota bacterium]